MRKYYVYEWFIEDTGEIFYVGKGSGNRVVSMKNRNEYFKNIRTKYKCNYRIVKDNLEEEEAYNLEYEYGMFLKSKNLCRACYVLGKTNKFIDKKIKKKISNSLKQHDSWNKGKTNCYSEETLKKMSKAKLGIKQSKETKEKRANTLKQKVIAVDPKTNKIFKEFDSINQGAEYFGINASSISKNLAGIYKTSKGYIWKKITHGNTESI